MEVTMFGRLQLYIFIGIIVFASLTAGYYSWRRGIEREALLEYNQHQLEQNVKDQQAIKQQLEDISAKEKEVQAANDAEKKALKDKLEAISADLNTKETAATDRPASDVLRKTINKLKDAVK
jgi:predicted Holliday junction resolvase-like endonuclease